MALEINPLDRQLELEGTGWVAIPYLGYVEINLQIPGVRGYNEDVMLVILTMTYAEKVLVMIVSKISDRAIKVIIKGELARAMETWRQAHFIAVMSGIFQLPHKYAGRNTALTKEASLLQPLTPLCLMSFAWTMSRGMSALLRGSPSLHLGLGMSMERQMSKSTVHRFMC